MGDDVLGSLDMRVQAMEMETGDVTNSSLAELLTSAAPTDSHPPRDPIPPSSGSSTTPPAAVKAEKAYRASLAELMAHADLPIDDLAKRFDFSFEDIDFAFQPFLYVPKGVFSVFVCRAVRYSATGDILTSYRVLPREATSEQVVTLDKMILARARHGLVEMALRKRVAAVVVPVSFETMTGRGTATEYLELLQKIPPDLRNYLVPALCRCPVGVPGGRLAELVNPLKRLSRAVSMRLESASQPLAPIKAAGAFSIGFNLATSAEMMAPGFAERCATNARKLGLHTLIDGIDTPELAARFRTVQADYLGGRMLAELSDYIGPVTEMRSA
jgi:hypothetical protein